MDTMRPHDPTNMLFAFEVRERSFPLPAQPLVTLPSFKIAGQSALPRLLSALIAPSLGLGIRGGNDWGLATVACVPLWWDDISANLRAIQVFIPAWSICELFER